MCISNKLYHLGKYKICNLNNLLSNHVILTMYPIVIKYCTKIVVYAAFLQDLIKINMIWCNCGTNVRKTDKMHSGEQLT